MTLSIMKKFIFILFLAITSGSTYGQFTKDSNTVSVNGIKLYYEVYGKGEPLFLLHGWTQSSQFWTKYISAYSEHFKVYAIDLRGHGKTSGLTDGFSIDKSASDILALLDIIKIKKVQAIGLSYGALSLLKLANLHPDRIEKMILIGASSEYNGSENTNLKESFSYESLPVSFIEQLNATHHGGENQIKALFNPELNYKISIDNDALKLVEIKTLIINGDRDEILGMTPAINLHQTLPNSALWIVPNTGHIAITDANTDIFLSKSVQFLLEDN